MKYLPIQQTVLNTKKTYQYNDPISCNNKSHFFKHKMFFRLHEGNITLFKTLFQKFMHDDLNIDWRN